MIQINLNIKYENKCSNKEQDKVKETRRLEKPKRHSAHAKSGRFSPKEVGD
jgi:hypothetical protein